MSEDKSEIKPEPSKPESKSEFSKPESKPEFTKPEPKAEFTPEPKSEFSNPEPKSEFDNPEIKPQKKPVIKHKFKKERQYAGIRFRFKFFFMILILALGIYFGTGPLIDSAAKFIIGNIFVNSEVSIGGLSIKPTRQISFLNIKISKGQIYDIAVKEASLDFSWPAIFKKITPELTLKNVKFTAKSSKTRLIDLIQSVKIRRAKKAVGKAKTAFGQAKDQTPGQSKARTQVKPNAPIPLISKLDMPDLNFDLDIQDAKASGVVSLSLNLLSNQLSFLTLNAKQLNLGSVSFKDVDLNALQGQRKEGLKIRQANFGTLNIKNIKSMAVLEGMILSLDDASGAFLSKKMTGEITLNLWPVLECTANAKAVGISAAALAKDLGWEDKMKLSGKLYAKAIFRSEGNALAMLNVNFITTPAGGTLTISDQQILRKISKQSRLSLAKVSENFLDYHFEKGQFKASLLEDTLSLEIILDGQRGRRNLKFDLQDPNFFGVN